MVVVRLEREERNNQENQCMRDHCCEMYVLTVLACHCQRQANQLEPRKSGSNRLGLIRPIILDIETQFRKQILEIKAIRIAYYSSEISTIADVLSRIKLCKCT